MNNYSKRIQQLPPYPFAELDKKKKALQAQGKDLIDLSIGDPDIPTPRPIVECMQQAVAKAEHHRYPPYAGTVKFREGVARWYMKRFGVQLDPQHEVLALIGSKEGIANAHYAFVDPGDIVLVPTPGYPVYTNATKFALGLPYLMPLHKSHHFLPDLNLIPENIAHKAKMMHLNYPNNPTGAVADPGFFQQAVSFAKQSNVIVCHDAPYTELYFDGHKQPSFLQTPGAKEVGVEFHSLSKTFNMTGWRLGFAVGNADIIRGLATIKMNIDSGQFTAVQEAGIFALDHEEELTPTIRHTYQDRRDVFVEALKKLGFKIDAPKATFYLWMEVPAGQTSATFATHLLDHCEIVATPGTAFGDAGEGFIRFSLTAPKERLLEAAERIKKLQ
ncbi:MAG: LL-diaminopimelate aminotransferase [Deltaproteobacteria bacterium]|nr:LL-diaminopimelate aminotransferase [Deltaproteobacteria bacterium]